MVPRRTLKRKLCNMSVRKAGDIYKSMTILRAKRKFNCYKDAFKYLLALAHENASRISSMEMNNRALARAVTKEKENSAFLLKEKLSTESSYLELVREYGILKTKLSSFEHNLTQIDDSVKTSMIPNLVRLSDDITTLKLNCDVLKNAVGTTYEPDTTTRIYPRNNPMEKKPRIISDANIPSPVLEETEDETIQLTARKCKGGLCNAFNTSITRDRRANRNLSSTANHESSYHELNSNSAEGRVSPSPSEVDRQSRVPSEFGNKSDVSSNVESSHIIPDSPMIIIYSPRPPANSPSVVLRRVLTPINSSDMNDSVHSTTVISFKDKSQSISTDDDLNRTLPKSERKRSTHSSHFGHYEEGGSNRSILTERKKSKQSYFFKKNDENKQCKKSETFKTSSHILDASSLNENNDHPNENVQPRRSKSRRKSSFRENEAPLDNFSLIGERKRYRTRSSTRNSILPCDEENSNQSTLKAENGKSLPNTAFGNETSTENILDDSRRLRTRSKNVCYKERPVNVKLRN